MRSRFYYHHTQTDSNFILEIVPCNCELLQFSARFSAPITTPALIQLSKNSRFGGFYNVMFKSLDPSGLSLQDWICSDEKVQFLKGDTLLGTYGNPDAVTIGWEFIFTEAGGR